MMAYSEGTKKEAVELYKTYRSTLKVGIILGVNRVTVSRWLKEHGVPVYIGQRLRVSPPNCKCAHCGKDFYVQQHRLRNGTVKYCSLKCKNKALGESKKLPLNLTCIVCRKRFRKPPAVIKSGGGKYCSKECYSKDQKGKATGENSPRWKGGVKNKKFKQYKRGAKTRGIEFHLTREQFMRFWKSPCSYCGSEIETIGLDRVDNNKGYTENNVTPCCEICNRMKLILQKNFFISHIEKIFNKRTIRNTKIGKNCEFWHYLNIYNSTIGNNCKIGSYVEISGATIGNNVSVGAQAFVPSGVTINDNVIIGPGVHFTHEFPPKPKGEWAPILVESDAMIGTKAIIMPGVTIGHAAIIGAGSVVTKSVPAFETWAGVPARKLK